MNRPATKNSGAASGTKRQKEWQKESLQTGQIQGLSTHETYCARLHRKTLSTKAKENSHGGWPMLFADATQVAELVACMPRLP